MGLRSCGERETAALRKQIEPSKRSAMIPGSAHYPAWAAADATQLNGRLRRWLQRAFASITTDLRLRAHRRVALHLEGLGDLRLVDPGFSAAEIGAVRAGRSVAEVLARRPRHPATGTITREET
jgi:hypothetical protein